MCNIFPHHYKHCVRAFLARFIVSLRHTPKIFSKRCLPHLGCRRVVHQFFVTRNCLPCDGVDHWIGVVFKVHRKFVFHQLCGYVNRVERGLFFQGEYIYCLLRDIASTCIAGEGRLGQCLLADRLDSCGCRTPLACRGRLCLEWDRTIEWSLREARSPLAGVSRLCVHRWYRMYYHGEWDNARCVVACGASVQSLGCFQHSFCRWIPGKHDRRCICNAWNSENGCFINHPLFCLTFPGATVRFHPLFVRHRGGIEDILDTQSQESE